MIYDVTLPITPEMVIWPGQAQPQCTRTLTMEHDSVEVSEFTLSSHTGTHIDAPRHFLPHFPNNAGGIDSISLDTLIGPCHVIEIHDSQQRSNYQITPHDLVQYDIRYPKVLFKTMNSQRNLLSHSTFSEEYVSLSVAAIEYLHDHNVHLIGIDYLSVEPMDAAGHPVHTALLEKNMVNIEGVHLTDVPPGNYQLIALPLRWNGADGSPARVVLETLH